MVVAAAMMCSMANNYLKRKRHGVVVIISRTPVVSLERKLLEEEFPPGTYFDYRVLGPKEDLATVVAFLGSLPGYIAIEVVVATRADRTTVQSVKGTAVPVLWREQLCHGAQISPSEHRT